MDLADGRSGQPAVRAEASQLPSVSAWSDVGQPASGGRRGPETRGGSEQVQDRTKHDFLGGLGQDRSLFLSLSLSFFKQFGL